MKKYRLLKDLPGILAGTTFIYNVSDDNYQIQGCLSKHQYELDYIESFPDWFEEIQEAKFTEQDMICFGERIRCVSGKNSDILMSNLFNEWMQIK